MYPDGVFTLLVSMCKASFAREKEEVESGRDFFNFLNDLYIVAPWRSVAKSEVSGKTWKVRDKKAYLLTPRGWIQMDRFTVTEDELRGEWELIEDPILIP